jgi:hypothetical protein
MRALFITSEGAIQKVDPNGEFTAWTIVPFQVRHPKTADNDLSAGWQQLSAESQ